MAKKKLIKLGSRTAKRGFRNERDIVKKFNNWQKDGDAGRETSKMLQFKINPVELFHN